MASPVDLVIRFTTSAPDLVLTIPLPRSTTTLSVKQQIRPHLPKEIAGSRLRLISAGKVLTDTSALSQSISIPPPPPRAASTSAKIDLKGKGKAPLRQSPPPQPNPRVYIHCSIGDTLTSEELITESKDAEAADAALVARTASTNISTAGNGDPALNSTSVPEPRGFERLLTAGFSAAEVATLRTQFLAIQSHTHTPDTMPTGDELRALEDRWLDSDAGVNARTGAGDGNEEGGFGAEDGGLEDMLWGNIMGFFWPVAAVCWLMREEGVWTRRRQIAVLSGMLVNLTFGFLRLTN